MHIHVYIYIYIYMFQVKAKIDKKKIIEEEDMKHHNNSLMELQRWEQMEKVREARPTPLSLSLSLPLHIYYTHTCIHTTIMYHRRAPRLVTLYGLRAVDMCACDYVYNVDGSMGRRLGGWVDGLRTHAFRPASIRVLQGLHGLDTRRAVAARKRQTNKGRKRWNEVPCYNEAVKQQRTGGVRNNSTVETA